MNEVTVYRTWDESMADMAVGLLRAEGIDARKVSDVPRSVYPVNVDGLGEIEIVVPEDDAPDALDILAVRFSGVDADISAEGSDDRDSSESEDDDFAPDMFEEETFGYDDDEEGR